MKLEYLDYDYYKVFINSSYIKKVNINNKEELAKYVKLVILKLRKLYGLILEGFYEVHFYNIKYIGIILELKNIDTYISKTIDLQIIIHNDEKYYLKTNNYEIAKKFKKINYYDNYFYLDVDNLTKSNFISLIENSEIVNESYIDNIKYKWNNLTF